MAAKKKMKQQDIPGTERVVHKDVRQKAEELYEVRSERMDLSKREKTLADELLALMKKHEIATYREGELTAEIVVKEERVRVKKKGEAEQDDG